MWGGVVVLLAVASAEAPDHPDCSRLLPGQFKCEEPHIDPQTQQPVDCSERNKAPVNCTTIPGLLCRRRTQTVTSTTSNFTSEVDCLFTSGKDWRLALGLSVFGGWLGLDRFYLGYPAIGLFKLCTLGFFFIFHLVDIILITLQRQSCAWLLAGYSGAVLHLRLNTSLPASASIHVFSGDAQLAHRRLAVLSHHSPSSATVSSFLGKVIVVLFGSSKEGASFNASFAVMPCPSQCISALEGCSQSCYCQRRQCEVEEASPRLPVFAPLVFTHSQVLFHGGLTPSGPSSLLHFWGLDYAAPQMYHLKNNWTSVETPMGAYGHSAVAWDNNFIFLFGGFRGNSSATALLLTSRGMEVVEDDSPWSTLAFVAATTVRWRSEDWVYAYGGLDPDSGLRSSALRRLRLSDLKKTETEQTTTTTATVSLRAKWEALETVIGPGEVEAGILVWDPGREELLLPGVTGLWALSLRCQRWRRLSTSRDHWQAGLVVGDVLILSPHNRRHRYFNLNCARWCQLKDVPSSLRLPEAREESSRLLGSHYSEQDSFILLLFQNAASLSLRFHNTSDYNVSETRNCSFDVCATLDCLSCTVKDHCIWSEEACVPVNHSISSTETTTNISSTVTNPTSTSPSSWPPSASSSSPPSASSGCPMETCEERSSCELCRLSGACVWKESVCHSRTEGEALPLCPACSSYRNCLSCQAVSDCTWFSNQCTSTTALMSTPRDCPEPCSTHRDCSACQSDSNCGWCEATAECYHSTMRPFLSCGHWTGPGACPVCKTLDKCQDCVGVIGCGWCGGWSGQCMALTTTSPPDQCAKEDWWLWECPLVDECGEGLSDCLAEAECEDTESGYRCHCPEGTIGDGRTVCERT